MGSGHQVELKGIDPPSIKDRRAERPTARSGHHPDRRGRATARDPDRRGRSSRRFSRRGCASRRSCGLADRRRRSCGLGRGQAIQTVFQAIHDGHQTSRCWPTRHQMMPKMPPATPTRSGSSHPAQGPEGLARHPRDRRHPPKWPDPQVSTWAPNADPAGRFSTTSLSLANKAVEDAIAEAERSANPGRNPRCAPGRPAG